MTYRTCWVFGATFDAGELFTVNGFVVSGVLMVRGVVLTPFELAMQLLRLYTKVIPVESDAITVVVGRTPDNLLSYE